MNKVIFFNQAAVIKSVESLKNLLEQQNKDDEDYEAYESVLSVMAPSLIMDIEEVTELAHMFRTPIIAIEFLWQCMLTEKFQEIPEIIRMLVIGQEILSCADEAILLQEFHANTIHVFEKRINLTLEEYNRSGGLKVFASVLETRELEDIVIQCATPLIMDVSAAISFARCFRTEQGQSAFLFDWVDFHTGAKTLKEAQMIRQVMNGWSSESAEICNSISNIMQERGFTEKTSSDKDFFPLSDEEISILKGFDVPTPAGLLESMGMSA